MDVVTGTQACSNFRPGFALKLYRQFCKPGDTVLDTSTGYGGRLVGFMASGIAGRYVGIDPNTLTHEGNLRMAFELGFSEVVELHNLPAEDVLVDSLPECDFAFTSPPYFSKEHYSDESTQSWVRYKTGEAWRTSFLIPMLRLQFGALRPGKFNLVNIADVKIKGKMYPLVDWTIDAAQQCGFRLVKQDKFPLQRRMGTGDHLPEKTAMEALLVFQKR